MIEFKDYPDITTPVNAANLNANFNFNEENIALTNSWAVNGKASIARSGHLSTLALGIKSGTGTGIGTLPEAYRPLGEIVSFPANASDGTAGYISINPSGVIVCSDNLVGKRLFANASWVT